jgi:hypothetical protein
MARLGLKAHHEMGPMGLGVRFSFALERDDVRARLCDRLGILGQTLISKQSLLDTGPQKYPQSVRRVTMPLPVKNLPTLFL